MNPLLRERVKVSLGAEFCHFTCHFQVVNCHFTLCRALFFAVNQVNLEKEGKMIHLLSFKWYWRLTYGFTFLFSTTSQPKFSNEEKFKEFYRKPRDVHYLNSAINILLYLLNHISVHIGASQVAPVVKNPPANAGDVSSVPGSGRSPGVGNGNLLQYFAWKILWREESGGLQSAGSQRVRHDWEHVHIHIDLFLSSSND